MKLKLLLLFFLIINSGFIFCQTEDCGNGTDDDGDGLVDCADPDCNGGTVPTGALFNTATNGSGGVLPGSSNDLNWQIATGSIVGPYTPAIVMSSVPGSYYLSPWPDCNWISHSSTGTHSVNTDYYYKIEFYLPCTNACGTSYSDSASFCLNMDFFVDNSVDEVYVNGIPQSAFLAGVPAASPYFNVGFTAGGGLTFSLCSDWQPGLNTLIIKVSSGPGYEGFLAQNSVSSPPVTGDPTILSPLSNYTTCINDDTLQYNAASTGGTWSASCGTCIDSLTGVFDPSVSGIGSFTITYTVNFPCIASDTAVINIIAVPDATITSDTITCLDNSPFNLTAITSGGYWVGTGITNSSLGTFNPSVSGVGYFQIIYSISGACAASDTLMLHVNNITINGLATDASCYGINDGVILVNGSESSVGMSGITHTYYLNGPMSSSNVNGNFSSLQTGVYTVWVTSSSGCDDSLTFTVNSPAEITAFFTADTVFGYAPLNVNLTNLSTNALTYYWDLGNATNATTTNASATYNNMGFYTVTLYAYNGICVDSFSIVIEVTLPSQLIVYNVFTPNNDASNDIYLSLNKNLKEYHCMIFDRWGILLFDTTNPEIGWDGKNITGKLCADGTYFYIINGKGIDNKVYDYHGTLTLLTKK